MSELTVGVNSSETLWTVDTVPDPEFGFYTIGSEIVQVTAGFPGGDPGYAVGQTFPSKIRVIRATNDTTAASHLAGATLTAANAFAGGGGGSGLDVTDGTTTVTGATTLSLDPGSVTDEGSGIASVSVAVLRSVVTLTDAQIKALPSTPVEVIPSAGAGKMVSPISVFAVIDCTAGDYNNVSVDASLFVVPVAQLGTSGFLDQALVGAGGGTFDDNSSVKVALFSPFQAVVNDLTSALVQAPVSNFVDQAHVIGMYNALGDLTGGNAANSIIVTSLYMVVDV